MALWTGLALLTAISQVAGTDTKLPEPSLTVNGIRECGFSADQHKITSRDGYVTTVFRMRPRAPTRRGVVLFQHGLFSSSDTWFGLKTDSLPCLVATEGYDVWLSNARGSHYSEEHATLPTKSYAYWNFSFHEMAVNDIRKTIEYVCSFTKSRQVSYIGHSMGGAINFVLLSTAPEFNRMVNVSVTFAPACFLKNMKSKFARPLADLLLKLKDGLTALTYGKIHKIPNFFREDINDDKCNLHDMQIMLLIAHALKLDELNRGSPGYMLDSTSVRTVAHIAMHIKYGTFAWYYWGNPDNYMASPPPAYELNRITTRQFIMYGEADVYVVPKDVRRLCSALSPGVGTCYKVPDKNFDHNDFMTKKSAKQLVYSEVLKVLGGSSVESRAERPNTKPGVRARTGCGPAARGRGSIGNPAGNPAGRARG